jgi:hypothetical protein
MRDIIWTVIIVWLVIKLVDFFRSFQTKKVFSNSQNNYRDPFQQQSRSNQSSSKENKKDVKQAIKKSIDKEGDYVDYEDVK